MPARTSQSRRPQSSSSTRSGRSLASSVSTSGDPLAFVTAPPVNESSEERDERLAAEREAKAVSERIDALLREQQAAEKKGPKAVKVLLLGQSESGKSTTLKNFQLMYEPKAFLKERASWRAVIQLNVVRSIHVIFEALHRSNTTTTDGVITLQDPELLKLKLRLAPLVGVQETLMKTLSNASDPAIITSGLANGAANPSPPTRSPTRSPTPHSHQSQSPSSHRKGNSDGIREITVNSTLPWKDVLSKLQQQPHRSSVRPEEGDINFDWSDPHDPGRILFECREDMKKLWAHAHVQSTLERQNVRLEEMAGFFLDELDTVAGERYIPSDDHILRARLKTVGVSETRVRMNPGGGVAPDWRIFDVGGHRSLRAAWVPYFDNMDAIIFLAPISAFDQVLAEQPKINRLEDSVMIWTQIVSNELLRNCELILFLNKCDIFKGKLESGIRMGEYVVSYGGRGNDFETASNYLRKKFAGILKENSPMPRMFYCHLTSVIDTKSTRKVIANVKDMLMRSNLKNSTLLA